MKDTTKTGGKAFRIVGLVLGIVGFAIAVTAVVFAAIGMHQARLCKKCTKGAEFR